MVAEVFLPGSLLYTAGVIVIALFVFNVIDTRKLLRVADDIDKKEKQELQPAPNHTIQSD